MKMCSFHWFARVHDAPYWQKAAFLLACHLPLLVACILMWSSGNIASLVVTALLLCVSIAFHLHQTMGSNATCHFALVDVLVAIAVFSLILSCIVSNQGATLEPVDAGLAAVALVFFLAFGKGVKPQSYFVGHTVWHILAAVLVARHLKLGLAR